MTAQHHWDVTTTMKVAVGAPAVSPDRRWDRIAAFFRCPRKTRAALQANGSQYRLEYLPDAVEAHPTRAFTVTLFRTPKEAQAANDHTEAVVRSMVNTAVKVGAELRIFRRYLVQGAPRALYEYVLNGERNIGVIAQSGVGMLVIHQLVLKSGEALTEEDRHYLRVMSGL